MVGKDLLHKKRLNAQERKVQIVASAVPLFAQMGFKSTTTKDIAKAAGISEALMYKHFSSKEQLYDEIQNHCCVNSDELSNALASLPPNTESLILSIYILVSMIIEGPVGDNDEVPHEYTKRLMIHSLSEDGLFAKQFVENRVEVWMPHFDRFLDAALEKGEVRPGRHAQGRFRIWVCHHLALAMALFRLPDVQVIDYKIDENDLVDESCWFLFRGLGIKDELIEKLYRPDIFKKFINA